MHLKKILLSKDSAEAIHDKALLSCQGLGEIYPVLYYTIFTAILYLIFNLGMHLKMRLSKDSAEAPRRSCAERLKLGLFLCCCTSSSEPLSSTRYRAAATSASMMRAKYGECLAAADLVHLCAFHSKMARTRVASTMPTSLFLGTCTVHACLNPFLTVGGFYHAHEHIFRHLHSPNACINPFLTVGGFYHAHMPVSRHLHSPHACINPSTV